jgi:hypothetical protein
MFGRQVPAAIDIAAMMTAASRSAERRASVASTAELALGLLLAAAASAGGATVRGRFQQVGGE